MSFQLVDPLGYSGHPVTGYSLPPASNSFSIDSNSGTISWDSPMNFGYYSVGILTTEWRSGVLIGSTTKDMLIEICQPNAVDEFPNINDAINIYPNPAHDKLIIAAASSPGNKYLNIYNALGEIIVSDFFTEEEHILNISYFAKGIYFIQIRTANSTITKRLVKL